MASNIKGITVEIGGNTGPLDKALKGVNSTTRNLQSELRQVQRGLKFNPSSTELLAQKQKVLAEQIENTKQKLNTLKEAQQQVQQQFNSGKIGEDKYRAFEREIETTENKLKNLQQQFNTTSPALQSFGQKAGEVGEKLKDAGEKMKSVGTSMTTKVTAPIAAGLTVAAKSAGDFGHQMADIQKEIAAKGENVSSVMSKMSSSSLKWSEDFGQSTDDINAGLLTLVKDGYSGSESMDIMKTSLYTARGANEDLATVVEQLGGALEAYGMKTSNAAQNTQNMSRMADSFAYISNHTKTSVSSLGESFSICGQTASSLKQPMEDTAGAIGELQSSNIDASTAARSLKDGLVNLTKPSAEMSEEMKKMKLNVFDAKGQMKEMPTILDEMNNGMKGWTDQQKQSAVATIFGKESLASWNVLLNKGGSNLRELATHAKNAKGEVKNLSDSMKNTDANKFKEFKESAHALAVSIGQEVLPVFTSLISKITSLIKSFSQLSPSTKKLIVDFGLVAAVVGPIIVIIGTLVEKIGSIATGVSGAIDVFSRLKRTVSEAGGVFALITSPIGLALLAIAGIAAVAILVIKNWTPIKSFFINLWNGVKQKFTEFWNWLKGFVVTWGPVFLAVAAPFIGIPILIVQHWTQIKATLTSVWNSIKATASSVFNGIASFFVSIWTAISNTFKTVIASIVSFVTTNFSGVLTGISTIFNGVKDYFTGVWEAIKTIFLGAVLLIIDLVTGNFTKLSSDAQLIWNDLKTAFGTIWNGIQQVFSGALQAISAFLSTTWNSILGVIQNIWNNIKSFFESTWQGIISTAQSDWNGFKSFFESLWQGIIAIIQGVPAVFENVGNTIVSAWNAVVSFFSSLPGRFMSFMSGVGNAITHGFDSAISFIKSLPAQFLEWGKDMIDNMVNGIKGGIGAVGDAVKSIADKIRSFLHFSVPDEGPLSDADTYGGDFMQLLADTIEQNEDKPTEAAAKVAKLVSDKIQSIKDTTASKVKELNDELGQLSQNEIFDLKNADSSTVNLIKNEYKQKREVIKQEIELRKQQANSEIAEIQRIGKENKDELKEELQERKDFASNVNDLNEKIKNALKEKYDAEEKIQEDSLNKELDNLDKWKDDSEKNIEDVANAKIAALQAESDALDEQEKQEEKVDKHKEYEDKIKDLQNQIKYSHDDYNKAELQKELASEQSEYQKELNSEAVSDKKDSLKKQMDNIKDDEDKQKQSIENVYNTKKSYIQKELDDLKNFYSKKTDDAELEAESEKMIADKSQKEIVALLNSYGDEYKQAGQTLGDRLADGFKPAIDSIKSMIASITAEISEARDSSISAMQMASTAVQINSPEGTSTVNTAAGNAKTVTNNFSFVHNSPTKATPSEERNQDETFFRKAAFSIG